MLFEETAEQLLNALRLESRLSTARPLLAQTRLEQGKPADVVKFYRDYLTADTQIADVYCELADLLMQLGDWNGAAAAYRSALGVDPEKSRARQGLEAAGKAADAANASAVAPGGAQG